jgi:hypothetical protein
MDNVNESRIIRFGLFEMDLRAGELRKNGIEDRSGDLGRLGRVVTSGHSDILCAIAETNWF